MSDAEIPKQRSFHVQYDPACKSFTRSSRRAKWQPVYVKSSVNVRTWRSRVRSGDLHLALDLHGLLGWRVVKALVQDAADRELSSMVAAS